MHAVRRAIARSNASAGPMFSRVAGRRVNAGAGSACATIDSPRQTRLPESSLDPDTDNNERSRLGAHPHSRAKLRYRLASGSLPERTRRKAKCLPDSPLSGIDGRLYQSRSLPPIPRTAVCHQFAVLAYKLSSDAAGHEMSVFFR